MQFYIDKPLKKAVTSVKPNNSMKQSSPAGKPKGNSKVI